MENIITTRALEKVFGSERAIEDVSFNVGKGEVFGFLGPSGAGKTTTIKILTGQMRATGGEAHVLGIPAEKVNTPAVLRRIGVMTDTSGLYERLSVYENLAFYADLYGVKQKRRRIGEVLDLVNLTGEEKKKVAKLSKGMMQRTILARALLHEPELVFLDEPTAALDPANSRHIHEGLKELNRRGTTIFLTTHDMEEAEHLCDQVAFLNKGQVRLMDNPKVLRRQHSDGRIVIELKNGKQVALANRPENAKKLHDYMAAGQIVSIQTNEPTLGDIFVDITGRELA
ncbi:bacitracin ABC transporter ATP-binding protein [Alteribacter lacisalsi]|uniref:Bacitracin ABC transporter ATP-binding protein n=1 Tax=Alteribacter lacisalsi TaxID=2045244 RepID=A0A2W0HRY8_9BACI|nr:ABC transporter ATP-binding protein [Alteribacter lacisalsi]PYZ96318.1 bacitracin ABC transporter ATP-binding protein [Alteribacter lacisalsi]